MAGPSYRYVDNAEDLNGLVSEIAKRDRIAVDIEADSLHHYRAKVCLIQISFSGQDYLVDPLCGLDMTPLLNAFQNTEMVFHAGDYDLRMLRSSYDFEPEAPIFDTMLAAQLLGEEQLGLVTIMEKYAGVTLSKSGQKSDWSRRPLSDKQIEYAVDDTRYLLDLAQRLEERLQKLGRRDWHRESCERMILGTQVDPDPTPADREWRIKGVRELGRRELAFVRSLWYWREREGQESDKPVFKILSREHLINLACWAAEHPEEDLKNGPSLPRNCNGRRRRRLVAALREAARLPKADWPQTRPKRVHEVRSEVDCDVLDALRAECVRIANEVGIAPSVLAPKAVLVELTRAETLTQLEMRESGPMLHWQAQLLHDSVRTIIEKVKK